MQRDEGTPAGDKAGGEAADNAFIRAVDRFSSLCKYLAGAMLVGIVIINGVNVFMRYVLAAALSWAEESMVFLMLASVFVGAIPVTWDKAHIRIDAFVASLPGRVRTGFEALAVLATVMILFPIGWISFGVVGKLKGFDQRSDALDLPVWIAQSTVPFALLLIPLVMVLALIRGTKGPHEH